MYECQYDANNVFMLFYKKKMVFLYESNLGIFSFRIVLFFHIVWGNIYYLGCVFHLRQLDDGIQKQEILNRLQKRSATEKQSFFLFCFYT